MLKIVKTSGYSRPDLMYTIYNTIPLIELKPVDIQAKTNVIIIIIIIIIACNCVIVNQLHKKMNVINYHCNYFSEKISIKLHLLRKV